jgi:hypothetical protein
VRVKKESKKKRKCGGGVSGDFANLTASLGFSLFLLPLLFVFFSVMLTGNAVPFFLFLLSLVLRAISLNRPSGNIYIYISKM